MADQNPQINQNVNNQNESDELFWWSDDIFENSDLLQPIDSEVATTHEVIKSQNDLNNFHWEVKSNQSPDEESLWNILDEQPEVSTVTQQPENIVSDDLFEDQPQEQKESNEPFDNLYDEAPQENQAQNNDVLVNDDIFEEGPVVEEKIDEIPEIEDVAEEDEPKEVKAQPEIKIEAKQPEIVSQPEVVDTPEIVENSNAENIQDNPNQQTENDDIYDDIDDLNDIEELDDIDDIDDIEDVQAWEWNTEVKEAVVPKKDEEDIEDGEEAEKWFVQNNVKVEEENNDADIAEEKDEEEQESSDDDIENNVIQDYEKYDPSQFKTDVQKKFGELQWKSEKIHELVWKDQDVWFDLLWWNDDRQKIIYKIVSWSDYIEIEKEELNKEDNSTTTNILSFELSEDIEQNMSVQLFVNDIELYDEIKDLQNDPNKKMQVLEKMNKFIFLLDEEYKKIQKYKKEKEERNAVKWVFRNF